MAPRAVIAHAFCPPQGGDHLPCYSVQLIVSILYVTAPRNQHLRAQKQLQAALSEDGNLSPDFAGVRDLGDKGTPYPFDPRGPPTKPLSIGPGPIGTGLSSDKVPPQPWQGE